MNRYITVNIHIHNNICNLLSQKNKVKNNDIIIKNNVAVICNSYVLISYKNISQSNRAEIVIKIVYTYHSHNQILWFEIQYFDNIKNIDKNIQTVEISKKG